jgi:hypothetical protein
MEEQKQLFKNIREITNFIKKSHIKAIKEIERDEILTILKELIQQDKIFSEHRLSFSNEET